MGHQSLHINDSALNKANSTGPGVGVAVLELEIDFLGAETHKRNLHVGLSDANDEDFATKLNGVDLDNSQFYCLKGSDGEEKELRLTAAAIEDSTPEHSRAVVNEPPASLDIATPASSIETPGSTL